MTSTSALTEQQRHTQLSDLLRFFPQGIRNNPTCGRKTFAHHYIIYWPDFAAAMRRSTVWCDRFCPPSLLDTDRKRRGIPTNGPAYTAWFQKALRRHVEKQLLPSLIIPTDSTVGGDYVTYALGLRGYGEDRIDDVNPKLWAALNDPKNYTFFKRITPDKCHVRRVQLQPPAFDAFRTQMSAVPREIAALYFAWRTVLSRGECPYDPAEVGIEWTDKGMLFINWEKFFTSPFKPPVNITAQECAAFLRGGHVSGKYRLKLSAFPDPHQFESIPAETRAINVDDFRTGHVPCSLVDTDYLDRRENLFDAFFHNKRRQKQVESRARTVSRIKQRRKEKQLTGDSPPLKTRRQAKVHSFYFQPFKHVPREFATFQKPLWFEEDFSEDVYAISFKGQLFFAQPAKLGIAAQAAPTEIEAWKRAMDRLSCIAQFTMKGDVLRIDNKSKTEQMKVLQQQEWEATAPHIIENFLSLDALTNVQLKRVKRATTRRLGEDTSIAVSGPYWYHAKMLGLARRTLPVSAVRREAYCTIPGRNHDMPKSHIFYSAHTLKQFLQESDGKAIPISPGLTPTAVQAAPYVYAWASFCLKMYEQGASYAVKDVKGNSHWTPEEDLILAQSYRLKPTLKNAKRAELLRQLPNHNWLGVTQRARQVNRLLKEMLVPAQWDRYLVGSSWHHPQLIKYSADQFHLEAKRIVMLIGVGMNRRYRHEPVHAQLVATRDVIKLNPYTLKSVVLPNTYRSDQFEALARG